MKLNLVMKTRSGLERREKVSLVLVLFLSLALFASCRTGSGNETPVAGKGPGSAEPTPPALKNKVFDNEPLPGLQGLPDISERPPEELKEIPFTLVYTTSVSGELLECG